MSKNFSVPLTIVLHIFKCMKSAGLAKCRYSGLRGDVSLRRREVEAAPVVATPIPPIKEPDPINTMYGSESELTWVMSSHVLDEAYRYLLSFDPESLIYAAGYCIGRVVIVERLVKVRMSHQSTCGVSADALAARNACVDMEQWGSLLVAMFHTHPGKGISATQPSFTDLKTITLYENTGYTTIGGIFSKDGYLRFFSNKRQFTVKIIGRRITGNDSEKTYKFVEDGNLPLQVAAAAS